MGAQKDCAATTADYFYLTLDRMDTEAPSSYYVRNRDKLLAYQREYHAQHVEKAKGYQKQYYETKTKPKNTAKSEAYRKRVEENRMKREEAVKTRQEAKEKKLQAKLAAAPKFIIEPGPFRIQFD